MSGHFNLSHDQYGETAKDTLKSLVTDEDFTDITLACAGDKQIKAHKVILGSYSTIFKNIILSVQQQNPVIYLRGVKYEELRAIINFIYLGETKVKQDNFASFMEIAQEFNIKGLAVNMEEPKKTNEEQSNFEKKEAVENVDVDYDIVEDTVFDNIEEGVVKTEQMGTGTDEVDADIQKAILVPQEKMGYDCTRCKKEFSDKSNLSRHIRSQHEGITYSCDLCDYKAKQSTNLNYHKIAKHSDCNPFECPNCRKPFSDKSNLQRHIKSQHEGIVYSCILCDYNSKQTTQLKAHMLKHNEILNSGKINEIIEYNVGTIFILFLF